MKFKETIKTLANATVYFFAVIFIIAVIIGGIRTCRKPIEELPSPVERKNEIDSLNAINQIILIEVDNLDSVKNVKKAEVKTLNNDSTLSLFYKLIRE